MRFDRPEPWNPIDSLRVVGQPVDRVDARLKVSGLAPYVADRSAEIDNLAYGCVVNAGIPTGTINAIDSVDALASAGVLAVVTADNAGPLGKGLFNNARQLAGPDIEHYHQAVAVVVAETFEQARAAAALVRITCTASAGRFALKDALEDAIKPPRVPGGEPPDTTHGDFESGFAAADVRLDETYTTADHSHAMMEPPGAIAFWEGERLILRLSTQTVDWVRSDAARILGIPKESIHVSSPFVGGGFGGKVSVGADALLAALGAKACKRPVKVVLPRSTMMNAMSRRPATIQRIRIGTSGAGQIEAIAHETWSGDLNAVRAEAGSLPTRLLYAGEHRQTTTRTAKLDLTAAGPMRAPGEAPGSMALEVAIDEMAHRLGIDPVEFRIMNDTQVDPERPHRPFSRRQLVECLRVGASQFDWGARSLRAGDTREGNWLIGMGCAAAFRNNVLTGSAARVRITPQGNVHVETDMTDIGTGTYTILAQTAAEMLGVPVHRVDVRLADSDFPVSCGSVGQLGANNSAAGVYAACIKLREAIAQRLGFNSRDIRFENGTVSAGNRSVPLSDAIGDVPLTGEDAIEYGDISKVHQQSTFGAHFVEVGVDHATAEIRVRRMLAVCASGRILNPKTARSQIIGGMTMGMGAALMEELALDAERGFFVNHDLAGYEIPVHADVPRQDVIFLEETDPESSPLRAKGVGELGICGVAAAIANAVHNATGVRLRDYPMTLDKLLPLLRQPE